MVIVLLPLLPWSTIKVSGEAVSVKFGVTVLSLTVVV
jgi:hypothetical protein